MENFNTPIPDHPQTSTLELVCAEFGAKVGVSVRVLQDAYDPDRIVLDILKRIPRLPQTGVYKTWETWWDAVKDRWFPKWFLKRYPVKWKKLEAWAIFPEIKEEIPWERTGPVYYVTAGDYDKFDCVRRERAKPDDCRRCAYRQHYEYCGIHKIGDGY